MSENTRQSGSRMTNREENTSRQSNNENDYSLGSNYYNDDFDSNSQTQQGRSRSSQYGPQDNYRQSERNDWQDRNEWEGQNRTRQNRGGWGMDNNQQYGSQYNSWENQRQQGTNYGPGRPQQSRENYNQGNQQYGGRNYDQEDYGAQSDRGNYGRSSQYGTRYAQGSMNNNESGDYMHKGKGPKGYKRSDERIQEDINDRLTDDPHIDASQVEVSVTNGEVKLSGTVDSRHAKRHAEDLAEAISGVSNVENSIRIQQENTGRNSSDMGSSKASKSATGSQSTANNTHDSNGSDKSKRTVQHN